MSLLSRNPITKEILGTFSIESAQSLKTKLNRLKTKKEILRKMDNNNRNNILKTLYNSIKKNEEELMEIVSVETGKSRSACEHEMKISLKYIDSLMNNSNVLLKTEQISTPMFKKVVTISLTILFIKCLYIPSL
jgi:acyl-CoA reductase-like NAD-dependent aldehyde dehydrogenase